MTHEKTISDLAYHLWHARGCPEGSADVDWAEAERQVRGSVAGAAEHTLEAPPTVSPLEPEPGNVAPPTASALEPEPGNVRPPAGTRSPKTAATAAGAADTPAGTPAPRAKKKTKR